MTLRVHVIESTSDPVAAPEFVGQHWINTSTGSQWLASGTSVVGDWIDITSGGGGGGVTDEHIRDVIGATLTDTSSVDLTYNDAADQISAVVLPAGVDHDSLQNYVANEHIDHSAVSITAGAGLTGGGDLTTTRTISMPNVGTAGTYQSVTTDAQGRVTAGTNPTTLSGYGITDAQPLDGDLTAVSNLAGTGLVTRTAADTMTTRTITGTSGRITLSNGDGISGNPTVDLATTAVTPGSYGNSGNVASVTVDAYGRLTATSNTAIDHTQITNIGTNTHAQIDTHIASTSNPHSVTAAQVGSSTAQWNADKLQGVDISTTSPTNGQVLTYDSGTTEWVPQDPSGGGGSVTDEHIRDVIGATLTDTATIDLTYNDAADQITADLKNTTVVAASYGSATQVATITVDAQGRLTAASDTSISIPSSAVTDFTEAAQDAVGAALVDTSSVDLTYNDASNQISAAVIPGGVDHNSLANLTTGDPHTQYLLSTTAASTYQPLDGDLTAVAALAGTGLVTRTATDTMTVRTITGTSGRVTLSNGDGISGNPTVDLATTTVSPGSYGSSGNTSTITVDAYGRLTAASNTAIDHTQITNIGTNTHAQIDTHIASTSNPHSVTAAQVGSSTAQWNADKLQGVSVDTTAPTDGQVLTYDSGTSKWVPETPSGGGGGYTSTYYQATATGSTTVTSTTDVVMNSMTITTPTAGDYLVSFSTSATHSSNGTTRINFSIYVGGSQVTHTEREMGMANFAYFTVGMTAIVTVNGSQDIDVRWKVPNTGTGTALERTLTAVRIA